MLNPYRVLQGLKPVDSIQDGVLVFEGRFRVPLASALSHVQQSEDLLKQKQIEPALAEARQAVATEPEAVQTEVALGNALKAAGQTDEARRAYEHALAEVATMEPGARESWQERVKKMMP